jgi:hypothetical protein
MQTDYLFHGIKGFERFAYYCYRYDMVSKEANRRYKIVLFYEKYGLDAMLEAFEISKRTLYRYKALLKKGDNKIEALEPKSKAPKRKSDLADAYKHSIPWVRKQIFVYEPSYKVHHPRAINLICDATFYGKRKDKLGTLVFKDSISKEVLIWKHIQSETRKDYKHLLSELLVLGYTINSITIDGKRGLYKALEAYPIQMCHFHQKRIIQRYITKHPKLQASKDLQKIMYKLTSTNETIFSKKLVTWYETYKDFLNEKTLNESTGKEYFTHAKLVSAYKSLRTNLPYLFTYKKHKHLNIQNTTNGLDGGVFSPMKKLLKIHNGFTKSLKLKMVDDYLLNYKKN